MSLKFRNKYRIPSIRLQNWDYSSNGYYFVTICIKDKKDYLGEIVNNEMCLSEIGTIAKKYWLEIPNHFSWQSQFYDHIIRNEKLYYYIRKYIKNNPIN